MPDSMLTRRRKARESAAAVKAVADVVKSLPMAFGPGRGGTAIDFQAVRSQVEAALTPVVGKTPAAIEQALHAQGLDWAQMFAPGKPLEPFSSYGGTPRSWNYVPGRNVSTVPRADRIPFGTLGQLIANYDVAQICVKHNINDIRSMTAQFTAIEGETDSIESAVKEAKRFLRRPDGKTPFRVWLAKYLQDVFRYDAGALYKMRNRGGKVCGLKVIDGTTIAPMIDYYGDRPDPPALAFSQFINGLPWDWLTTDDLIYEPLNPLPESPYGLAPIEAVILTANTNIRFQWHFLQYFTAGTVPEGFMKAPPDQSNPTQLEEWQDTWDAIMYGDQEKLRQIRWVPAGSDYVPAKTEQWNAAFPEHLERLTCAAFSRVPQDLGLVADVNRANGEVQMDLQFRIGTLPPTMHVEDIINSVLQDDLELPIHFGFDTGREKEDRLAEATAHQIWINSGVESPDEPREKILGLPVDPSKAIPRFIASRTGLITLDQLIATSGPINQETMGPVEAVPASSSTAIGAPPAPPEGEEPPPPGPGGAPTGPRVIPPNVPPNVVPPPPPIPPGDLSAKATGATSGVTSGTNIAGDGLVGGHKTKSKPVDDEDDDEDEDEDAAKLLLWRSNARSRVRKGLRPRRFSDLSGGRSEAVWSKLETATTRAEVDAAFKAAEDPKADAGQTGGPKWPGLKYDLALAGYYAQKIAAARERAVGGVTDAVARRLSASKATNGPPGITLNTGELAKILKEMYQASYQAGAHAGDEWLSSKGVSVSADLTGTEAGDWSEWEPGWSKAAELLSDAGPGLQGLLDRAEVTIQAMTDTMMAQIETALQVGVAAGQNMAGVTSAVNDAIGNPASAEMIARTETARAMVTGTLDTYLANGVEQWNFIVADGACPICEDLAAGSPYPMDDTSDAPPAHPRCRCATTAVIDTTSSTEEGE